MRASYDEPEMPDHGSPLVATRWRWATTSCAVAAATLALAQTALTWTHATRSLFSIALPLLVACSAETLLVGALLGSEESRLARELRMARTGTAILRGISARGRQQQPWLTRMFSTGLGSAAVLLADGNRSGALDALAAVTPWMRGGRLDGLRTVVEADLDRATGTSPGRDRCIQRLRTMSRLGHREADRYAIHVLVKATLERGDADVALELATRLTAAEDEDERLYGTWLRVWFDLDLECDGDWPPLVDGHARLAALVARAQGADKLVGKIEARLLAIARPRPQE
jgi:hypothetical protein